MVGELIHVDCVLLPVHDALLGVDDELLPVHDELLHMDGELLLCMMRC